MANWYCGSTKYTAVTQWAALTTLSVGAIRRQLATPTVGNERCFRVSAITTGITGASEPSWTLTHNGTTTDSGVTWTECTGQAIYNGDGGGSAYAAPFARMYSAASSGWATTGDTVYISNNHAETQSTSINWPNFVGINFICVNDSAVPPTATATTASQSTTTAGSIAIVANFVTSKGYFYGVNFTAGSSATTATNLNIASNMTQQIVFEACSFNLGSTSAAASISIQAGTNQDIILINSSMTFNNSSQEIEGIGFSMYGGSFAATGVVPSNLFGGPSTAINQPILLRDVDLSAITGTLFSAFSGSPVVYGQSFLENCKLGSGVVLTSSFSSGCFAYNPSLHVHNDDSTATNYRYYFANTTGTVQSETTVVRMGGASNGTTSLSWNFATASTSTYFVPFVSEEIAVWNNVSGTAQTITAYLTSNSSLDNSKVWIEIEYPSSTGSPLGATVNTRMALLGTPTALTSDTSTWGGSITNKYKITSPSFTPQMVGPIKMRIYVAVPSTTIYVDPDIYDSSGKSISRSYLIPGWGYINETGSTPGGLLINPGMTGGLSG